MGKLLICFFLCIILFANALSLTIINDTVSYKRIPSPSNVIGVVDILDEIHITFDFIIHSFPFIASIASMLRFGNNENESYPSIFIDNLSQELVVEFTSVSVAENDQRFKFPVSLSTLYQFEFLITQNRVQLTVNNIVIYNNYTQSHSVTINRNIYIGDNVYNAANATIYGLMVTINNSENNFNYLCDYPNRFNSNGVGNWLFNASTCHLSQTDTSAFVSIVWLGDNDMLSKQWTDYKVEVVLNIKSGETTLVLFRAQSIGVDDYGYYYALVFSAIGQQIRMQRIDNGGWTRIQSDTPITIQYNVDYTLLCDVHDNMFDVYFNGQWIFQATDNNFASGSIGLRTYGAHVVFKSLRITFATDLDPITMNPTIYPSTTPTLIPTVLPTLIPSGFPTTTTSASLSPTMQPTILPTMYPSLIVTSEPTNHGDIEVSETTSLIDKSGGINGKNDSWIYIIIAGGIVICFLIIAVCIIFSILHKKRSGESGDMLENVVKINDYNHDMLNVSKSVSKEDLVEMNTLNEGYNDETDMNIGNDITCGHQEGTDDDVEIANSTDNIVTNDGINAMGNDEFVINEDVDIVNNIDNIVTDNGMNAIENDEFVIDGDDDQTMA